MHSPMAIYDSHKYLPIRLEIIRIRRYNKRYIAPADAGEAWKKGRNMKKSISSLSLSMSRQAKTFPSGSRIGMTISLLDMELQAI